MIDVVVPVFAGRKETVRCIEAVIATRASLTCPFELIVIDDASPDPEITSYLANLKGHELLTVLANTRNMGFVATANRGMCLHSERDVVLLNSDTEVVNDWLDRLNACAYREPDIGTVTPFSNNATICSFPVVCKNNPIPLGMSVSDVDTICATVNAGKLVELPTAVGFCMYIRRDCIAEVGLFDEQRFPRGYGEENDFCRRALRLGWRSVLAADTFVFHAGSTSFGTERELLVTRAEKTLDALYPDYYPEVRRFVRTDPIASLRRAVEIEMARLRLKSRHPGSYSNESKGVLLHVVHDMGGGAERWLNDICHVSTGNLSLILRPYYSREMTIEGLMLCLGIEATQPTQLWRYDETFDTCTVSHAGYARALAEVIDKYQVGSILVSSLIGHALDVLKTGLPTIWVGHDYFPICPAIQLHFKDVCHVCNDVVLAECTWDNHNFNPFAGLNLADRMAIRRKFISLLADGTITLVAPTYAMWQHLITVFPEVANANWVRIPHGADTSLQPIKIPENSTGGRIRVIVLGQLSISKGYLLLEELLGNIGDVAEFHLVGAQEMGELFEDHPQVKVIRNYGLGELQDIVAEIRPHLGLLLSICPETFSYTLSELMRMGVPPLTTRLGAFSERLIEGETGFLVSPRTDEILEKIRGLASDHAALHRVRLNLMELPHRNLGDMVGDYARLLPVGALSPAIPTSQKLIEVHRNLRGDEMLLIRQRKRIKSLQLEADIRSVRIGRLCGALNAMRDERSRLELSLSEKEAKIGSLSIKAEKLEVELGEIFNSTVWKCSAPLRVWGRVRHQIQRLLMQRLRQVVSGSRSLPQYLRTRMASYRSRQNGGAGKEAAQGKSLVDEQDFWQDYRNNFLSGVKPKILDRIDEMASRPLISIVVPTFNTPQRMLLEMLNSVTAQFYPNWELCVADDGSDQPHVRSILERWAADDKRIKLSFGTGNRGVSNASNTALNLCTGDFVVFLDHDDMLEEHALFRVAESVCEDNPDMIYSDELLISEDGSQVLKVAYRPAFSPEYLRGHPYIVHLIGFRNDLLKKIGGFDESLRISQDYDLILRASEVAKKIAHIPDILYRWRIHESSAGHKEISQVMATSKAVIQRHLGRCNEKGRVGDESGFNLFDVRYLLDSSIEVAIIILDGGRVDKLSVCVDSILSTVGDVHFEIYLVSNASTEERAIRCIDRFWQQVHVIKCEDKLNEAEMRNWAAGQVSESSTHVLFCDEAIEAVSSGWLERLIEMAERPGCACVGAKLLRPDRITVQHAGVTWVTMRDGFKDGSENAQFCQDELEYIGMPYLNREVSAVSLSCMLVRAAVFRSLGGFDETVRTEYNSIDLCLRARVRGYRVLYCPHASVVIDAGNTDFISNQSNSKGVDNFYGKLSKVLAAGDPYWNPGMAYEDGRNGGQVIRSAFEIRRRVFVRGTLYGWQDMSVRS